MSDVERNVSRQMTVRYWAGAKAAAGTDSETYDVSEGTSLAGLLDRIEARHGSGGDLARTLAVCSFLVGDQPVARSHAAEAQLDGASVVEALPPFAGG